MIEIITTNGLVPRYFEFLEWNDVVAQVIKELLDDGFEVLVKQR